MDNNRVRRWLDQQRYSQVLEAVGHVADSGGGAASEEEAWALLLRCRREQGLVREAEDLVTSACGRFPEDGVADLWCRLVILQRNMPGLSPAGFSTCLQRFTRRATDPSAAAPVRALATDLRGQALALRYSFSERRPQDRERIGRSWAEAAAPYRRAGLPGDADRTLRAIAKFLWHGPHFAPSTARRLLRTAHYEATLRNDALAATEAEFALAELELRLWFADPSWAEEDLRPPATALHHAANRIEAAGGCLGRERAHWVLGELHLEHGLSAGVELAEFAAEGFRGADVPGRELPIWMYLVTWYTHRGDAAARARAQREVMALTERTGHRLAESAGVIGEADAAARDGDRGRAEVILSRRDARSDREFPQQVLLRACTLADVGLTDNAVELLRALAAKLEERPAPGGLLVEVLVVLAHLVVARDASEARAFLERGAAVAHDLGLVGEEARCLALEAWVAVLGAAAHGGAPLLSPDEITDRFGQAISLLHTLTTLEARSDLVSVYQQRGQAAYLSHDLEGCLRWLSSAEEVARRWKLGPQLAFTLAYEAMVMVSLARRGGTSHLYDEADGLLQEAHGMFVSGLRGESWRTLYLRGVCAAEAGDRLPNPQRSRHWSQADTMLTAAAAEIDRLRAASATEETPALQAQTMMIAFGQDKGEIYRLGFELHWNRMVDSIEALRWLERARARALLDGLRAITEVTSAQAAPARAEPPPPGGAERTGGPGRDRDGLAGYLRLTAADPPSYPELRSALEKEEQHATGRRVILTEYRCTPRETLLFGLRSDWEAPRVAAVSLDHERLDRFAALYFRRPGGTRLMMQDLADGGTRDWHSFTSLVAPLAEWTSPGDVIHLVPHGILQDLPLHTLPVDGEPLLLRNPVSYSPSAAVLLEIVNRPVRGMSARSGACGVFGDPHGNLPRAADEARTVAGLRSVAPRIGAEVTRASVLEALGSCAVVHVAGHGHLTTGNGFERGMELADGILAALDLLTQRVRAGVVVLSGCETGVNERRAGEEPVGLPRALLLGGAASVVVSQWKVADASAAALLSAFHRHLADGLGCAEALHHAARTVAGPATRRRHLYDWGAFVNVGDWR
ncbi:CHAT domain-containing protein [Streptomyces sp. NPDC047860]|uniref:CHAT domain-containing protein n=1 Tax=Streptomyces sp. NPDC047860 TaxID=3155743 RepID=UPI0033D5233F